MKSPEVNANSEVSTELIKLKRMELNLKRLKKQIFEEMKTNGIFSETYIKKNILGQDG